MEQLHWLRCSTAHVLCEALTKRVLLVRTSVKSSEVIAVLLFSLSYSGNRPQEHIFKTVRQQSFP